MKRTLTREELPAVILVRTSLLRDCDFFQPVYFNDQNIMDWSSKNAQWCAASDKPLKDIEWKLFTVDDGKMEEKKTWRRYYDASTKLKWCRLDEGCFYDLLFDIVPAANKEEAMLIPWKRKVKKTVNCRAFEVSSTTWFIIGDYVQLPKGVRGTFTYEIEEEV